MNELSRKKVEKLEQTVAEFQGNKGYYSNQTKFRTCLPLVERKFSFPYRGHIN